MPNVIIQTKRIVEFIVKIRTMIAKAGYDVGQAELACQSAVNEIKGKEGETKIGDVKHKGSGKAKVGWKENHPMEFEGNTSTPADFLAWHDSLALHFKKHGEPKGELTIDLVPEILVFWLDTMKARATAKLAKDKADGKAALDATRAQVGNGPTGRRNKTTPAPTPAPTA